MQYWKPEGAWFVGDCMPFWHDGVFHLFYLLDENHHQGLGGMGGHQWAHMSTTDLRRWQHHPLALPIDQPQERSICTGSVFGAGGQYHAFYATRLPDWRQVLSRAISADAIHFIKQKPNPFFTPPPGYSPLHFRDPFVFMDPDGGYHMIVTAMREDGPLEGCGGCLAHLTSPDLETWQMGEPLLAPGYDDAPECSDLFESGGWYYLLFGSHLTTHYRMARSPFGPWLRPAADVLDGPLAAVMKTAPFGADRRIGAAWLGTRTGDRDDGKPQWGGNLILREIVQHADGTLGVAFPAELMPAGAPPLPLSWQPLTPGAACGGDSVQLAAAGSLEAVTAGGLPHDLHIRLQVLSEPGAACFGVRLRSTAFNNGYTLAVLPQERCVRLNDQAIYAVAGLDGLLTLDIVAQGDILDVSIAGAGSHRCILDRCPQRRGDRVYFYAHNANLTLEHVTVQPLGN